MLGVSAHILFYFVITTPILFKEVDNDQRDHLTRWCKGKHPQLIYANGTHRHGAVTHMPL